MIEWFHINSLLVKRIDQVSKRYQQRPLTAIHIFISKSEAKAMNRLFNMALMGYSLSVVLEKEFRFTPQDLTKLLHHHNFLNK